MKNPDKIQQECLVYFCNAQDTWNCSSQEVGRFHINLKKEKHQSCRTLWICIFKIILLHACNLCCRYTVKNLFFHSRLSVLQHIFTCYCSGKTHVAESNSHLQANSKVPYKTQQRNPSALEILDFVVMLWCFYQWRQYFLFVQFCVIIWKYWFVTWSCCCCFFGLKLLWAYNENGLWIFYRM
jgi:hypothetical protein